MKKNLFLPLLCAFSALFSPILTAQTPTYHVLTQAEPAGILIEEFTAIGCSYCPQAHEISNNLNALFPDRIHVIANHVSSLAIPSGKTPDLRSPYGETFFAWQKSSGMPSGDINRTFYPECSNPESYTIGRGDWNKVSKRLLQTKDTAPINLWAKATLNTETRTLSLEVEGYVVKKPTSHPTPLGLNVALTENFILGPQAGTAISPYLHRHVLREILTPMLGDTLKASELEPGAYFKRTYTYTVPAKYNNLEPDLSNLECVIYIGDSLKAILQTISTHVESSARAPLSRVQISFKKITNKRYAYPYFDISVVNPSSDTIKSLRFKCSINGVEGEYNSEACLILPKTEGIARINIGEYAIKKINLYLLSAIEANSKKISSNDVYSDFQSYANLTATSFKVVFHSDMFAAENEIFVKNRQGEVLLHEGPFTSGEIKTYTTKAVPVEKNQIYTIEITDSFRDGVLTENAYSLIDEKGAIFFTENIGYDGDLITFGNPPDVAKEKEQNASTAQASLLPNPAQTLSTLSLKGWKEGPIQVKIYNLRGQELDHFQCTSNSLGAAELKINTQAYPQGLYLVRINQNTTQIVEKLIIKK